MPNLFHRLGDTAERIGARITACAHSIALHLGFHWAEFRGDDTKALKIMKDIIMADFAKFDAALDRVAALVAANAAVVAAANTAEADFQAEVDARTAKLDALAPEPAPAPVEPQPDPVIEPPVLDLNPNA